MEKLLNEYASMKFMLEIKQFMEDEDENSPFFGILLIKQMGDLKEKLENEWCAIDELISIISKQEIHSILLKVHSKYYNSIFNKK